MRLVCQFQPHAHVLFYNDIVILEFYRSKLSLNMFCIPCNCYSVISTSVNHDIGAFCLRDFAKGDADSEESDANLQVLLFTAVHVERNNLNIVASDLYRTT